MLYVTIFLPFSQCSMADTSINTAKAETLIFAADAEYENNNYLSALEKLKLAEGLLGEKSAEIVAIEIKVRYEIGQYYQVESLLEYFFTIESSKETKKSIAPYLVENEKAIALFEEKMARARIAAELNRPPKIVHQVEVSLSKKSAEKLDLFRQRVRQRFGRESEIKTQVILGFRITTSGDVADMKIVKSYPSGREFDREALEKLQEAVSQWKYEPKIENGVSVDSLQQVKVIFEYPLINNGVISHLKYIQKNIR